MKKNVFLYLASKSERRIEILKEMKLPFSVVQSRYRETPDHSIEPEDLVMKHALGKAKAALLPAAAKTKAGRIVLGADTVVCFEGKNLGKPAGYAEAEALLARMSGRVHYVYTGIALIEPRTGKTAVRFDRTKVKFRRWTRDKISTYVRLARSLDKAGGYAIQCRPSIVLSYQGSLSNVIGLPKELLARMLRGMHSDL